MTRLVGATTFSNKTLYSTEHLAHIHKHWVSVASNHEDKRQSIDHSISPVTQVTSFHSVVSGSDHWSVITYHTPETMVSHRTHPTLLFQAMLVKRLLCLHFKVALYFPALGQSWDHLWSSPLLCCYLLLTLLCFSPLHLLFPEIPKSLFFFFPPKLCGSKDFLLCVCFPGKIRQHRVPD